MIESKEDFVVVLGDASNTTVQGYQSIMTKYTTKNRSTPFYYLNTADVDKLEDYVKKTFESEVSYPVTFIIKEGKMVAKKEGAMQYYSLYDFVKENFK